MARVSRRLKRRILKTILREPHYRLVALSQSEPILLMSAQNRRAISPGAFAAANLTIGWDKETSYHPVKAGRKA
jgi:hypothetical protein